MPSGSRTSFPATIASSGRDSTAASRPRRSASTERPPSTSRFRENPFDEPLGAAGGGDRGPLRRRACEATMNVLVVDDSATARLLISEPVEDGARRRQPPGHITEAAD